MSGLATRYKVIDIDTHVVEPADLWTSRLSAQKFGDAIPHVKRDQNGVDSWYFGDERALGAALFAHAGWHEAAPSGPKTILEAERSTWDAHARLKQMDKTGIYAQVLFPNLVFFGAKVLNRLDNHNLMMDCVRAYNDWQVDWSSADPKRFLPQAVLPVWDVDLAVQEMERCRKMGHRGIVFTSEPHHFKQPRLTNKHWNKLWATAQDLEMPVNFHIASGDGTEMKELIDRESSGERAGHATLGVLFFMSNVVALTQIIMGGICHRFPKLNFVSAESGVSWLPFAISAMDWHWKNCYVREEKLEYDLLPSEYFRRQVYGSFWFEEPELVKVAIDLLGDNNILYETDFPHPTSMSPGPASYADNPKDYIEKVFKGVPESSAEKILHGNAARIYHLDS